MAGHFQLCSASSFSFFFLMHVNTFCLVMIEVDCSGVEWCMLG